MPVIKKHQTTLDFAAQHAGAAEAAFDIALINGIGITDEPTPGTDLLPVGIFDDRVAAFYQETGLVIATKTKANDVLAGIGYWIINVNFKVS